jgi:uncharacterized protein with von Willebrand factor type A (vWA) domain
VGNQTGVVLIADQSRDQTAPHPRVRLLSHLTRTLGTAVKGIVPYSETAWLARSADVDQDENCHRHYGSNLHHALILGRDRCKDSGANRIALILGSFPSAHLLPGGEVFFNYPPVHETIQATMEEATLLASEDVRLDAVVLGDFSDRAGEKLSEFMARMTGPTGGIVMTARTDEPLDAVVGRFLTRSRLD